MFAERGEADTGAPEQAPEQLEQDSEHDWGGNQTEQADQRIGRWQGRASAKTKDGKHQVEAVFRKQRWLGWWYCVCNINVFYIPLSCVWSVKQKKFI